MTTKDAPGTGLQVARLSVDLGGQRILDTISFAIEAGEWLGICGANGAGKTTLIRALAGRLPIRSGQISVTDGERSASRSELAAAIGFPVSGDELPASLRVGDILRLLADQNGGEPAPLAQELLATLALDTVANKQVRQLSSGWRQRLSIYSAFVPLRPITILDEPFNWLDPVTAFSLKGLLRSHVESGATLVTCEHDLTTIVYKCDRAIFLTRGRLTAEFGREQLADARTDFEEFEARLVRLMSDERRE